MPVFYFQEINRDKTIPNIKNFCVLHDPNSAPS